jgi:hypothetical protein
MKFNFGFNLFVILVIVYAYEYLFEIAIYAIYEKFSDVPAFYMEVAMSTYVYIASRLCTLVWI